MDTVEQAKPNARSHSPWVSRAAIKGHVLVDLDVVGNTPALPDRPDGIQNVRAGMGGRGQHAAPVDRNIKGIQAVKADQAGQRTGPQQVKLLSLIGERCWQLGIPLAFGFIPPSSAMVQLATVEDTVNRAEGREWFYTQVLQFPTVLFSPECYICPEVFPHPRTVAQQVLGRSQSLFS